ncbi:MAG: S8 family serine peptidase, partial [Kangiellaceae bacterium]
MDSNHTPKRLKFGLTISALTLSCAMAGPVVAEPAQRFIVKYKDASQEKSPQSQRIKQMIRRLSEKSGISLAHLRKMALENRHVITLPEGIDRSKFITMMNKLRQDSNVLAIEEDALMQPTFVPNDEFYNLQWHYHEATGGMNAEAAWDTNDGTGVVVAVLDTGITDHSDLNANILPGYDFIEDLDVSNDGDGRDADASDPGDWVAAFECGFHGAQNSSWHGTHVSGTIAAVTDNEQG